MNIINENNNQVSSFLVIDDDVSILQFFIDAFNEMNYVIDTVSDGKIGGQQALNNNYKMIFLDIKIQQVNGLDVLREIRRTNKKVKIIMISGYLTEDIIEEALSIGADGYLNKPLTARDIFAKAINYLDEPGLDNSHSN
ncbi:MAG: response regulator [Candidatus Marinimicrobia bacterium]|nr:response regulator [Candidatus Neomarinimicrobiota bacterium]